MQFTQQQIETLSAENRAFGWLAIPFDCPPTVRGRILETRARRMRVEKRSMPKTGTHDVHYKTSHSSESNAEWLEYAAAELTKRQL
jgi:hypothetical protein